MKQTHVVQRDELAYDAELGTEYTYWKKGAQINYIHLTTEEQNAADLSVDDFWEGWSRLSEDGTYAYTSASGVSVRLEVLSLENERISPASYLYDIEDEKYIPALVIGKVIRDTRYKSNLTQEEVANKLGTSKQHISSYESHKREPSVTAFIDIIQACGGDPVQAIAEVKKFLKLVEESRKGE